MKNLILISLLTLCIAVISCTKENNETEDTSREECQALEGAVLTPICSFNPKTNTATQFPISLTLDDVYMDYEHYSFLWDSGSMANAVSTSYDQLPISVTITELATDCTLVLELNQSYWP